jgi:FkbM family methyltransferase
MRDARPQRLSQFRASLRRRLESRAKAILARRGLELRRTKRGMRWTLPAVVAHYRRLGLDPATVIDVGVAAGTPELYRAFPAARLLLIEPLEEWQATLEQALAKRDVEVVTAAAGAEPGEVEITVHRVLACSSMLGARRGDDADTQRRVVPRVRLDDVARERDLPGPFVVKVDVEGGELQVLDGARTILREAELVLLEVSLFELVPGTPLLHDVVGWMHEHGFVVADVYNGHNRPLDGALAQLDIAFVQRDGKFRSNHAYATPEQADALYRSWGL